MSSYKIIFGQTAQQYLDWVPPERILSATYEIVDSSIYSSGTADRVIVSGSVSVDDFSTTTGAAAGSDQADPRSISLGDTAGTEIGRRYQISDVNTGEFEYFTLAGRTANTTLVSETRIVGTYASGSTVAGVFFEIPFPTGSATDEDLFLLDNALELHLTYDVRGRLAHERHLVHMVRSSEPDTAVDEVEHSISRTWPGYAVRFTDGHKLRYTIESAKADIEAALLSQGIKPTEYLTGPVGMRALYWRSLWMLAFLGDPPGSMDQAEFSAMADAKYQELLGHLLAGNTPEHTAQVDRSTDTIDERGFENPFLES